jgi:hypothetical protein
MRLREIADENPTADCWTAWAYDVRVLNRGGRVHARGAGGAGGRSMPAKRVKEILMVLFRERGAAEYLRSTTGRSSSQRN